MIRRHLRDIIKKLKIQYLVLKQRKITIKAGTIAEGRETYEFPISNTCRYTLKYEATLDSSYKYKWVGAQILGDRIIAIPNDEIQVLMHDEGGWTKLGKLEDGAHKWTGGCVWNGSVYAFPRAANCFLKIDDNLESIPLQVSYNQEHHYSGVCTLEGTVYQPPRNTNHILKTNLMNGHSKMIEIASQWMHVKLNYCGSIIHPNGLIYLFPADNERVIKLNPQTDEWKFIGKSISTCVFDAKVGIDGNIYGYSAYGCGIMKINVLNDNVEMIHAESYFGAYGTKYGLDGCMYSVPGDGSKIWKYDVANDVLTEVYDLKSEQKAKYAGGVVDRKGKITFIPATADRVLTLMPDIEVDIPEDVYNIFYTDNY